MPANSTPLPFTPCSITHIIQFSSVILEQTDCEHTADTCLLSSNTRLDMYSFFLSLTFWGIVSLSFVYAKGYAALLTLR